jgi:hypothetical protein
MFWQFRGLNFIKNKITPRNYTEELNLLALSTVRQMCVNNNKKAVRAMVRNFNGTLELATKFIDLDKTYEAEWDEFYKTGKWSVFGSRKVYDLFCIVRDLFQYHSKNRPNPQDFLITNGDEMQYKLLDMQNKTIPFWRASGKINDAVIQDFAPKYKGRVSRLRQIGYLARIALIGLSFWLSPIMATTLGIAGGWGYLLYYSVLGIIRGILILSSFIANSNSTNNKFKTDDLFSPKINLHSVNIQKNPKKHVQKIHSQKKSSTSQKGVQTPSKRNSELKNLNLKTNRPTR